MSIHTFYYYRFCLVFEDYIIKTYKLLLVCFILQITYHILLMTDVEHLPIDKIIRIAGVLGLSYGINYLISNMLKP